MSGSNEQEYGSCAAMSPHAALRHLHREVRFYKECLAAAVKGLATLDHSWTAERWEQQIKHEVLTRMAAEDREEQHMSNINTEPIAPNCAVLKQKRQEGTT